MLSSVSVERLGRSIEPEVWLGEGQEQRQESQNKTTRTLTQYILTIFAPNDLYNPAILKCRTREEFLKWHHIARRCGYFHEVSTN